MSHQNSMIQEKKNWKIFEFLPVQRKKSIELAITAIAIKRCKVGIVDGGWGKSFKINFELFRSQIRKDKPRSRKKIGDKNKVKKTWKQTKKQMILKKFAIILCGKIEEKLNEKETQKKFIKIRKI